MAANIIKKPILISGGGLASLLLAQALLRASIPFLIFERDAGFSFRAQGYRLRLSAEGLDAIENVLGSKDFGGFWDLCGKTGGSGFAALNATTGGKIVEPPNDGGSGKPNIPKESLSSRDGKIVGVSRGDMRRFFSSGCESYIRWSHHVTGYELTPSGVHAIFADDSRSVEGDMFLKASWKVYDTGARGIHGQAPSTAFRGLGEGVWRMTDETNPKGRVFVMTNVRPGEMDDPNVQFGWTMGSVPGVIKAPNDNYSITGTVAADIAKDLTSNWHPRIKPLFDEMVESDAAFWKITCSTPSGVPEWESEPRVTVIGDAAHSMTPAGGIGANTAVRDSALLGRLLAEAGGYGDGVTTAYEKKMRTYASEAVRASYQFATGGFGIVIDENSPTV